MQTIQVTAAAALLTVVVAVTGACEDSQGATGSKSEALYPVGNIHHLCAPSKRTQEFTEGFDTFANRGPAPVTVDRVEWPTTGDVATTSIRVFQRQPGDRFATLGILGKSPERQPPSSERRAWERAQPAEGATLGLADPDEGYLVFVIGVTGSEGTGGPLTIHYTDADGATGVATSQVDLQINPTCE